MTDAKQRLSEVLSETNSPVAFDDAVDALEESNPIVAEATVNRLAEVEDRDGERVIVAVGDVRVDEADEADDDGADEAAESPSEPVESDDDPSPPAEFSTAQQPAQDGWTDDGPQEVYEVNGLRITDDPAEELIGEPTGDDYYGLPILENGNPLIRRAVTPYFPVELEGDRDSEEALCRMLGVMVRPVVLEGDAGSGKNQAIKATHDVTNRIYDRINFGSDVSVLDLVGQKDLDGRGDTVYELGGLTKAAMFGHTVVFDEVDMARGDVTSFIHAAAESPGSRQLELRGTSRTLVDLPVTEEDIAEHGSWYAAARAMWDDEAHLGRYIHPEFRVTATCNGLEYADTKEQNDAFRDRFTPIIHPYLEPEQEADLLATKFEGLEPSRVFPLCRLAKTLREARKNTSTPTMPISHRALEDVVDYAGPDESFMSFKEAAYQVMANRAQLKNDRQYIRDAIADEL